MRTRGTGRSGIAPLTLLTITMNTVDPKVSVCLMTYNGAATVDRALTTLLAQTYRDYELVISDDHSTDETLAICHRLANGHERVRFIRPEHNLGAYGNMRFALSQAKGKYFVWACQDDYWEAEFLERLVDVLEQSPTAVCAQGRVHRVSEDRSVVEEVRLSGRDLPERQSRIGLATSILVHRSQRWGVFMHGLWNRAALAAAYAAHDGAPSDERQILCQLALAGEFRYVDQLLFHKVISSVPLNRRRAPTDVTLVSREAVNREDALERTLEAVMRSPIVPPTTKFIAPPVLRSAFWWHRMKRKNEGRAAAVLENLLPAPLYGTLRRLHGALKPGTRKDAGLLRKKS